MIKTEKEYKDAVHRIEELEKVIKQQEKALKKEGLSKEEIKRGMDPTKIFFLQLTEEVQWYEKAKQGNFESILDLKGVGRLLIALRIASGLTQKELGQCLGVSQEQVAKDERNEYHGISIDRAQKILNTFRVHIEGKIKIEKPLVRKQILTAMAR
jgi:DNA-binding XRE family transcriptional regulator